MPKPTHVGARQSNAALAAPVRPVHHALLQEERQAVLHPRHAVQRRHHVQQGLDAGARRREGQLLQVFFLNFGPCFKSLGSAARGVCGCGRAERRRSGALPPPSPLLPPPRALIHFCVHAVLVPPRQSGGLPFPYPISNPTPPHACTHTRTHTRVQRRTSAHARTFAKLARQKCSVLAHPSSTTMSKLASNASAAAFAAAPLPLPARRVAAAIAPLSCKGTCRGGVGGGRLSVHGACTQKRAQPGLPAAVRSPLPARRAAAAIVPLSCATTGGCAWGWADG